LGLAVLIVHRCQLKLGQTCQILVGAGIKLQQVLFGVGNFFSCASESAA